MKADKRILVTFVLNLAFSCFEFVGGLLTGSIALTSDAIHDLGDAVSIGVSYALERKGRQQPDGIYTYGYGRYSVMGAALTTLVLLVGSGAVLYHAVDRLLRPVEIHYDGMILFAVVGVCVNFGAVYLTRGGSLSRKAVSLHMLEDLLGWLVVLAGAVVMRFTGIAVLDPLLSIGVALFIAAHALRHTAEAFRIFLERAPCGMDAKEVRERVFEAAGVLDVHHVHLWTIEGQNHCATMHIVTDADTAQVKTAVRERLRELGISHVTLELERSAESCRAVDCCMEPAGDLHHPCHG